MIDSRAQAKYCDSSLFLKRVIGDHTYVIVHGHNQYIAIISTHTHSAKLKTSCQSFWTRIQFVSASDPQNVLITFSHTQRRRLLLVVCAGVVGPVKGLCLSLLFSVLSHGACVSGGYSA